MTDATWKSHPGSKDFNTGSNWTGNTIPDGTATFGASSIHALSFSAVDTMIGGWTFAANAGTYNFTIPAGDVVAFTGAGIVTKGGSKVNIDNKQGLEFSDSSSAGKAHITNHSGVTFDDMSNASSSTIINNGNLLFEGQSSLGSAKITNNDLMVIREDADIGSATITTTKGGDLTLLDHVQAINAHFIVNGGGTLDLSQRPAHDTVNIDFLSGGGTIELGDSTLELGSLNKSMKLSGLIEDNGVSDAGALVKLGTGTLTLSHANNAYEGGTAIEGGTLNLAAKGAAGSFFISFAVGDKATLKIENAALDHHAFDSNEINGFAVGDAFDFAGLKFVKGAKATLEGGTELSVKSGGVTDTISLFNFNPDATTFLVKNDGHGGTKVIAVNGIGEKGDQHDSLDTGHVSVAQTPPAADLFHDFI